MTKDELNEYLVLSRKIETKKRLLQALRSTGTQVLQDSVKGSTKYYPYTEVTFHLEGVSDEPSNETDQRRVAEQIDELNAQLEQVRNKIMQFIDSIEDEQEALVLECTYIRGFTQRKTASIMNYDAAWVNRVLKKYV